MVQKPKQSQIDWLKAVILERMDDMDANLEDVAVLSSIGRTTVSKLFRQRTEEWPYEQRKRILKALRIKVADLPAEVQMKIAQA